MPKVVLMGAGSYVLVRDFISDVVSHPVLGESTVTLHDADKERLELAAAYARRLTKQQNLNLRLESTTDRRAALDGADYVINSFRSGGWAPVIKDREITMRLGIEIQSDAMGVGGVFSGLRHVPDVLEICHNMEEVCPDAWLFNHRWRDGGRCPRTGRPLVRAEVGGRTTCWSPARQKRR